MEVWEKIGRKGVVRRVRRGGGSLNSIDEIMIVEKTHQSRERERERHTHTHTHTDRQRETERKNFWVKKRLIHTKICKMIDALFVFVLIEILIINTKNISKTNHNHS